MSNALDIFNIDLNPEDSAIDKIEERFDKERKDWVTVIDEMSQKMKNMEKLSELMLTIYTDRQRCAEYHSYLLSKLININRIYRQKYTERFEYWTWRSNIRYPNNNALNTKILTELDQILKKRELIDNHSKYIATTLSTIDNIIYAVPKRVEIEKIKKGM